MSSRLRWLLGDAEGRAMAMLKVKLGAAVAHPGQGFTAAKDGAPGPLSTHLGHTAKPRTLSEADAATIA